MTTPVSFTPVTQLDLDDEHLVGELKLRISQNRFEFIQESRPNILHLREKHKLINKSNATHVDNLWKLLMKEAITLLKIYSPQEWQLKGQLGTPEQMEGLRAFGVDELYDYFIRFKEFEHLLYGADEYYRGHVVHVFRVWMLGALLLDDWDQRGWRPNFDFCDLLSGKNGKEPEAKAARENAEKLITYEEIQAMWAIIALSHDLGYPLEKTDTINTSTRDMLRKYGKVNIQDFRFDVPQVHQFINDFILRFISSRLVYKGDKEVLLRALASTSNEVSEKLEFQIHTQSKYYLKFSKSLEDYEHGIFSSIILMKNLTYFLESDFELDQMKPLDLEDARQWAIRREMLRAIASHTCEEIYYIRPDTLAFLLILCDELQCWGRPTLTEMMHEESVRGESSAKLRSFTSNKVEFSLIFQMHSSKDAEKGLEVWAAHIFRRFQKMLRAAYDAPKRTFTCHFEISSTRRKSSVYKFEFQAAGGIQEFCFRKNNNKWDPWGVK